jgi:hypothetical protein
MTSDRVNMPRTHVGFSFSSLHLCEGGQSFDSHAELLQLLLFKVVTYCWVLHKLQHVCNSDLCKVLSFRHRQVLSNIPLLHNLKFRYLASNRSKPFSETGKHAKMGRHGDFEHFTTNRASQNVPGGQNLSTQSNFYINKQGNSYLLQWHKQQSKR